MNFFKNGTLIAIAAAALIGPACKKDKKSAPATDENAPATTDTAATDKAAPTEPAGGTPAATDTATPPAAADGEKTAMVHCMGVNDCKGKGGCKSAKNDCKGKNACKGKSFTDMQSEEECKAKGGTVAANP